MSIADPPRTMTAEEFLALPDDGVHRELIRGEVRVICQEPWDDPHAPVIPIVTPEGRPMTYRSRKHSRGVVKIGRYLDVWMDDQPEPRGEVVGGECGFRLAGPEDSIVGIDVAVVSAELRAATPEGQKIYDGPPVLAVEILSPSDKHEDIVEMVALCLEFGVVVWVVDPDLKTIAVHRPGEPPETFNVRQELVGGPELPGFRVRVADLLGE